jgi:hypothetical protein
MFCIFCCSTGETQCLGTAAYDGGAPTLHSVWPMINPTSAVVNRSCAAAMKQKVSGPTMPSPHPKTKCAHELNQTLRKCSSAGRRRMVPVSGVSEGKLKTRDPAAHCAPPHRSGAFIHHYTCIRNYIIGPSIGIGGALRGLKSRTQPCDWANRQQQS